MTRLIETQSKWGNLYNRRQYVDGVRVSNHDFSRMWLELGCTRESGRTESTSYGFRTIWETGADSAPSGDDPAPAAPATPETVESSPADALRPVYGLKGAPRSYACDHCGHAETISTNHTGPCANYCGGCSWSPSRYPIAMHWQGRAYRAFHYVGGLPGPDELNPYAIPAALESALGTYPLDSIGGRAIARGWIQAMAGQPLSSAIWPYLISRGWHAATAAAKVAES